MIEGMSEGISRLTEVRADDLNSLRYQLVGYLFRLFVLIRHGRFGFSLCHLHFPALKMPTMREGLTLLSGNVRIVTS